MRIPYQPSGSAFGALESYLEGDAVQQATLQETFDFQSLLIINYQ